jgi:flagellar hook assembly protein FlgD
MTRILLYFSLILFSFQGLKAQTVGNEWIDYSQKYFQIKIYETGWYRLDFTAVDAAFATQFINTASINSNQYQIFGREKEQPINVVDGGDGVLNAGDYIEFYAEKNDGWKDSLLFDSPADQPDQYYSYVNDTILYYLSFTTSGNGKRFIPESDVNSAAYPLADYCWVTNYERLVTTSYNFGPLYFDLSSPTYGRGEGWTAGSIRAISNTVKDVFINTSNAYTTLGAPSARIGSSISSASNFVVAGSGYNHSFRIQYTTSHITILDTSFGGYDLIKTVTEIDPSTLTNGDTKVRHRGINIGQGNNEKLFLSSVTIDYPHTFDFEGEDFFEFWLPNNSTGIKQTLNISNFTGTSPRLFIFNDGGKEIPLTLNGGNYEAVIPNNTINDSILIRMIDNDGFLTCPQPSPVMANGSFFDYNNIDPTDAYIIISHEKLWTSAQDYATYRSSFAGGLNDVVLIDINELYHQYGGGIEKHPVAIRGFLKDVFAAWSTEPQHLFLLGKSIGNHVDQNKGSREEISSFRNNLVPTWGYPGSDNHLSQGVNGTGKSYAIATGRFSANSNGDVITYLNKVKEYELQQDSNSFYNIPNKEWQKTVLQFGGGSEPPEIAIIDYYLNTYDTQLSDTLMGAVVHDYFKDPFSPSLDAQTFFEVQEHLQEGVSLMTFYGHASAGGGFSQNIDSPDNWNNPGKYPLVVGLGCYAGDVHGVDTLTYANQLVNPPNEGAIGLISTVKLGFITNIGYYTQEMYRAATTYGYAQSMGKAMKHATDTLFQAIGSNFWQIPNESNYTGMSLQGDPGLKLNAHNAPELVLDENRIWTVPGQIDLSIDTFELHVVVTNIGKAFYGDFELNVERFTPTGLDTSFSVIQQKSMNRDTVIFRIPTKHSTSNGLNKFNISVDLPFSQITEHQDEIGNNQITFSTFISSNGIQPIWPYKYAIIPTDTITLKASTLNPFEPLKDYIFEVDTIDSFNSSFKKQQFITSIGGVLEASPGNWLNSITGQSDSLVYTDSTVYYWRCSPDSTSKNWLESSFQYIPDHWGWGQSHFYQYKNDGYQGLEFNRPNRQFDFGPNFAKLRIVSNISFVSSTDWQATGWYLNGIQQDYGGWTSPSIMIGVVDPCTLLGWGTPWFDSETSTCVNPNNDFGQFNGDPICSPGLNLMGRNRPHGFFVFKFNSPSEMDSLASMLENKIPDGHYVIAYTYINNNYSSSLDLYGSMPPELITAFQNLGATNINYSQDDDGFVFLGRKGFPADAVELHSDSSVSGGANYPVQHLVFQDSIFGCNTGYLTSEIVGPAFNWNRIYWKHNPSETNSSDSTHLRVYGVKYNGTETLLIDNYMTLYDSILNLNNLIDASVYPMLKLQAAFYDTLLFTPSQMERWQVIYDPVPELAVNPKKGFYAKSNDTYQQGDSAAIAIAIENVSAFDMDSLSVAYWYINQNGTKVNIPYPKQDSLRSLEVLYDTITFPTNNISGNSYFWMTANPYITSNIQDQPEQFYFNNIAQKSFNVSEDDINPILDVTFDGIHILDEDIISAEPLILITLDDENEFLLLDKDTDTSYFEVFLKTPSGNSFKRIYFMQNGEEVLKWTTAQNEKNKFTIEYNPKYTEDGIYTLQVQGRDKSNNFSGDNSYEISFEIVTSSTITHIFNYPNPFSTSTQFVFTLTGSELPDQMQIQIMTVTGKVVREIHLSEIGPLRIGNNRTEYAWDGRDEFGDQLANGVYLYRVIAKINGENIEHRSTTADDQAFKKGFGKMYLMR